MSSQNDVVADLNCEFFTFCTSKILEQTNCEYLTTFNLPIMKNSNQFSVI